MLIEFRVENHRSLRDEQVLTMEASGSTTGDDPRPRHEGHSQPLLPVAAIYGANASGKSNVVGALAFMRDAVIQSHRSWAPEGGVPRDQFAWGPKGAEPSSFEVTLFLDGIRYQYGFRVSDEAFLEESLYAWPHGKKQTWFERDETGFRFGDHLRGENKIIQEVTRENALFLSAAAQHRHEQLMPVYFWFARLYSNIVNRRFGWRHFSPEHSIARLLEENAAEERQQNLFGATAGDESLVTRFKGMVRNADVGIVDVRVVSDEMADDSRRPRARRIELRHACAFDDAWLPLEEESRGTQTLFRLALPILTAIEIGSVVLVDELEASLHPTLARQIVQQFNDPSTNPLNAQLVFTTHDTNLLGTTVGEPTLRRDQVWLTEKDRDGASQLYPLTDFKPRKTENLERGYLQGRYGAIPFLGGFSVTGDG